MGNKIKFVVAVGGCSVVNYVLGYTALIDRFFQLSFFDFVAWSLTVITGLVLYSIWRR